MKNLFNTVEERLGIKLSTLQQNQFKSYFDFLIEYNKKINLTRITEEQEVYYKHFFDSLTICKLVDFTMITKICDLGSGAGFPGIPLAIVFSNIKFTLVDSLGKRIIFLNELVKKLNLSNVKIVNARAEEFAQKNLNTFDLVTARAFSQLGIFLEIAIPLAKEKGLVCALKGSNYKEELDKSKLILGKLETSLIKEENFDLPNQYGKRVILIFKKRKFVKGYPRKYSVIKKEYII